MSTTRDLFEIPFFTGFTPEEVKIVSEIIEEIEFEDGALIVQENATTSIGLYFVANGRINIFKAERGSQNPLTILDRNDLFGEVSFIDEKAPSASAKAVGAVRVLKLAPASFKNILKDCPMTGNKFYCHLIRELSRRFRAVSEGIDVKSPDQTIAEVIANGTQVKISTQNVDFICKILYADRNSVNAMMKIDMKGQQMLLPFSQVRGITLPNRDGKLV